MTASGHPATKQIKKKLDLKKISSNVGAYWVEEIVEKSPKDYSKLTCYGIWTANLMTALLILIAMLGRLK